MTLSPDEYERLNAEIRSNDLPDKLEDREGASPFVAKYRQYLESKGKFDPRTDSEITLMMGDRLREMQGMGERSQAASTIEYTNPAFRDDYLDLDLQRQDGSMGGELMGGLESASRGLVGTMSGAYGMTGLPGHESAYQWGVDVQTNSPRASVRKFEDLWRANGISMEALKLYAPNVVGQAIPSLVEGVAAFLIGSSTAGAGAAALYGSKKAVQSGVRAAMRKSLKKKINTKQIEYGPDHKLVRDGIKQADELMDVEDAAAYLWKTKGGVASSALNSLALNSGEIYNTLREDGFSHEESQMSALAYGSMAALPDSFLPSWVGRSFLRRTGLMGQSKAAKEGGLAWLGKQTKALRDSTPARIGFGIALEGSTEGLQEYINIAAPAWKRGEDIVFDEETKSRILNASVIGMVAGGIGSLGTLVGSRKEKTPSQTDLPTEATPYSTPRPTDYAPGGLVMFTGNSNKKQLGRIVRTTGEGTTVEPVLTITPREDGPAAVSKTGSPVVIPTESIIGVPTAEDLTVATAPQDQTEALAEAAEEVAEAEETADTLTPQQESRERLEAEKQLIEQDLVNGSIDNEEQANQRLAELDEILDSFPTAETDIVISDSEPASTDEVVTTDIEDEESTAPQESTQESTGGDLRMAEILAADPFTQSIEETEADALLSDKPPPKKKTVRKPSKIKQSAELVSAYATYDTPLDQKFSIPKPSTRVKRLLSERLVDYSQIKKKQLDDRIKKLSKLKSQTSKKAVVLRRQIEERQELQSLLVDRIKEARATEARFGDMVATVVEEAIGEDEGGDGGEGEEEEATIVPQVKKSPKPKVKVNAKRIAQLENDLTAARERLELRNREVARIKTEQGGKVKVTTKQSVKSTDPLFRAERAVRDEEIRIGQIERDLDRAKGVDYTDPISVAASIGLIDSDEATALEEEAAEPSASGEAPVITKLKQRPISKDADVVLYDKEGSNTATGGWSGDEILKEIIKTGTKLHSAIAKRLVKLPEFKSVRVGFSPDLSSDMGAFARYMFTRENGVGGIAVYENATEEYVLHELMHAATSHSVPRGLVTSEKGFKLRQEIKDRNLKKLSDLWVDAVNAYNDRESNGLQSWIDTEGQQKVAHPGIIGRDGVKTDYGRLWYQAVEGSLGSFDEFMADLYTSPELHSYLQKIPSSGDPSKSFFTEIVEILAEMLGFDAQGATLLEESLLSLDKFIQSKTPKTKRKRTKQKQSKKRKKAKSYRLGGRKRKAKIAFKSPSGQQGEYSTSEMDDIANLRNLKLEDGTNYNSIRGDLVKEILEETANFRSGFITPKQLYDKVEARFTEPLRNLRPEDQVETKRWVIEAADDVLVDLRRKIGDGSDDSQKYRLRVLEVHNNFRRDPIDVVYTTADDNPSTTPFEYFYPTAQKKDVDEGTGKIKGGAAVRRSKSVDATNPISAALAIKKSMGADRFKKHTTFDQLSDPLTGGGEISTLGVLFRSTKAPSSLKTHYYEIRKGGGKSHNPAAYKAKINGENFHGAFLILTNGSDLFVTDHTGRRIRVVHPDGTVVQDVQADIPVPSEDTAIKIYPNKKSAVKGGDAQWGLVERIINIAGQDESEVLESLKSLSNGGNNKTANLGGKAGDRYSTRAAVILEAPNGKTIMTGLSDFTAETRKNLYPHAGHLGVIQFLNVQKGQRKVQQGKNNVPAPLQEVIDAGYKPRLVIRLGKFIKARGKAVDSISGYVEQRAWSNYDKFDAWLENVATDRGGTRQQDLGDTKETKRDTFKQAFPPLVKKLMSSNLGTAELNNILELIGNEYVPESGEEVADLFKAGGLDAVLARINTIVEPRLPSDFLKWDDIYDAIADMQDEDGLGFDKPIEWLQGLAKTNLDQANQAIADATPIESNEVFEELGESWPEAKPTEEDYARAEKELREQGMYMPWAEGTKPSDIERDNPDWGIKERAILIAEERLGQTKKRVADSYSEHTRAARLDISFTQLEEALRSAGLDVQKFKKDMTSTYEFLHANNAAINETDGIVRIVMDDILRPNGTNLLSLFHESTHFVLDNLPGVQRTALLNAILKAEKEFGQAKLSDRLGRLKRMVENGEISQKIYDDQTTAEELIVESVARNLTEANIDKGVIRAIIRKVREVFYRILNAVARAAGLDDMLAADLAERYLTVKVEQFVGMDNDVLPDFLSFIRGPSYTAGEQASALNYKADNIPDENRYGNLYNPELTPSSPEAIAVNRANSIALSSPSDYTTSVERGVNTRLWTEFDKMSDGEITVQKITEFAENETLSNTFQDMTKTGLIPPRIEILPNNNARLKGKPAVYHFRGGDMATIYIARDFGYATQQPTSETEMSAYLDLQKAVLAEIVGHELAHHVSTSVFIDAKQSGRLASPAFAPKAKQVAEDWTQIYNAAYRAADPTSRATMYGFTSVQEFVSEATNNPRFQKYLSTIALPDQLSKRFKLKSARIWDAFNFAFGRAVQPNVNLHKASQALMKRTIEAGAASLSARKSFNPTEFILRQSWAKPEHRIDLTMDAYIEHAILSRFSPLGTRQAMLEAAEINIEETVDLGDGQQVPMNYIQTGGERLDYAGMSLLPNTRYLLSRPRTKQEPEPPLSMLQNPMTVARSGMGFVKPADEDIWRIVRTESFKRFFGDWQNEPLGSTNVGAFRHDTGEPMFVFTSVQQDSFVRQDAVPIDSTQPIAGFDDMSAGEREVVADAIGGRTVYPIVQGDQAFARAGAVTDPAGGNPVADGQLEEDVLGQVFSPNRVGIARGQGGTDTMYGQFGTPTVYEATQWGDTTSQWREGAFEEMHKAGLLKSYFESFAIHGENTSMQFPEELESFLSSNTRVSPGANDMHSGSLKGAGVNVSPIYLTSIVYSDKNVSSENRYTVPTGLQQSAPAFDMMYGGEMQDVAKLSATSLKLGSKYGISAENASKAVARMYYLPGNISVQTKNTSDTVYNKNSTHGYIAMEAANGSVEYFKLKRSLTDEYALEKLKHLGERAMSVGDYDELTLPGWTYNKVVEEVGGTDGVIRDESKLDPQNENYATDAEYRKVTFTGQINFDNLAEFIEPVNVSEFNEHARIMSEKMDTVMSRMHDEMQLLFTGNLVKVNLKNKMSARQINESMDNVERLEQGLEPYRPHGKVVNPAGSKEIVPSATFTDDSVEPMAFASGMSGTGTPNIPNPEWQSTTWEELAELEGIDIENLLHANGHENWYTREDWRRLTDKQKKEENNRLEDGQRIILTDDPIASSHPRHSGGQVLIHYPYDPENNVYDAMLNGSQLPIFSGARNILRVNEGASDMTYATLSTSMVNVAQQLLNANPPRHMIRSHGNYKGLTKDAQNAYTADDPTNPGAWYDQVHDLDRNYGLSDGGGSTAYTSGDPLVSYRYPLTSLSTLVSGRDRIFNKIPGTNMVEISDGDLNALIAGQIYDGTAEGYEQKLDIINDSFTEKPMEEIRSDLELISDGEEAMKYGTDLPSGKSAVDPLTVYSSFIHASVKSRGLVKTKEMGAEQERTPRARLGEHEEAVSKTISWMFASGYSKPDIRAILATIKFGDELLAQEEYTTDSEGRPTDPAAMGEPAFARNDYRPFDRPRISQEQTKKDASGKVIKRFKGFRYEANNNPTPQQLTAFQLAIRQHSAMSGIPHVQLLGYISTLNKIRMIQEEGNPGNLGTIYTNSKMGLSQIPRMRMESLQQDIHANELFVDVAKRLDETTPVVVNRDSTPANQTGDVIVKDNKLFKIDRMSRKEASEQVFGSIVLNLATVKNPPKTFVRIPKSGTTKEQHKNFYDDLEWENKGTDQQETSKVNAYKYEEAKGLIKATTTNTGGRERDLEILEHLKEEMARVPLGKKPQNFVPVSPKKVASDIEKTWEKQYPEYMGETDESVADSSLKGQVVDPDFTPSFGVILIDENDGSYVMRETANNYDGYGWTFPKGQVDKTERSDGSSVYSETPLAAAIRELKEETGISITEDNIIGHLRKGYTSKRYLDDPSGVAIDYDVGRGSRTFYYVATLPKSAKRKQADGGDYEYAVATPIGLAETVGGDKGYSINVSGWSGGAKLSGINFNKDNTRNLQLFQRRGDAFDVGSVTPLHTSMYFGDTKLKLGEGSVEGVNTDATTQAGAALLHALPNQFLHHAARDAGFPTGTVTKTTETTREEDLDDIIDEYSYSGRAEAEKSAAGIGAYEIEEYTPRMERDGKRITLDDLPFTSSVGEALGLSPQDIKEATKEAEPDMANKPLIPSNIESTLDEAQVEEIVEQGGFWNWLSEVSEDSELFYGGLEKFKPVAGVKFTTEKTDENVVYSASPDDDPTSVTLDAVFPPTERITRTEEQLVETSDTKVMDVNLVKGGDDLYGGNASLEQWKAESGAMLFDNGIWQSDTLLRKINNNPNTQRAYAEAIGSSVSNYITGGLVSSVKVAKNEELESFKVKDMTELKESPALRKHVSRYSESEIPSPDILMEKQRVLDLIVHAVGDYIVNNRDGHAGNFGLNKSGRVIAFDKGQSLRFYEVNSSDGPLAAVNESHARDYMGTTVADMADEVSKDGIARFVETQFGGKEDFGNPRVMYNMLRDLVSANFPDGRLSPERILAELAPVVNRAGKLKVALSDKDFVDALFDDYSKGQDWMDPEAYKNQLATEMAFRSANMEEKIIEFVTYLTGNVGEWRKPFDMAKGANVPADFQGVARMSDFQNQSVLSPYTIKIKNEQFGGDVKSLINKKMEIVRNGIRPHYMNRLIKGGDLGDKMQESYQEASTQAEIKEALPPRGPAAEYNQNLMGMLVAGARSALPLMPALNYDVVHYGNVIDSPSTGGDVRTDQLHFLNPGDSVTGVKSVYNQGGFESYKHRIDDDAGSEVSDSIQRTNAYDSTQAASNAMLLDSIALAHQDAIQAGYKGNLQEYIKRYYKINPEDNLAAIAERDPGVADASITDFSDNPAMTDRTLRFAGELHSKTMRNLMRKKDSIEANLEKVDDEIQQRAEEITELETKWRDSQVHEKAAQSNIRRLIKDYVRGMDGQVDMTFAQGQLLGAIQEVEQIISGDSLSAVYRDALFNIFDGNVRVFEYIQAMAELGVDYGKATEQEIINAISNSERPILAELQRNKPLLSTLVAFSKDQALQMALLEARTTKDMDESGKIDEEIRRTQKLSEDQLKELRAEIGGIRKSVSKVYKVRDAYAEARLTHKRKVKQADKYREDIRFYDRAIKSINEQELELQSRLGAGYDFNAVPGEQFYVMQKVGDEWVATVSTYSVEGTDANRSAIENAKYFNKAYLAEQHRQGKGHTPFNRMLADMTMQLSKAVVHREYRAMNMGIISRNLSTLEQRLRALGQSGVQVSRMVAEFRRIQANAKNDEQFLAGKWEGAFKSAIQASGMSMDVFKEMIYDTGMYWIESLPEFANDDTALYNQVFNEIKKVYKSQGKVAPDKLKNALEGLWRATDAMAVFQDRLANENNVLVEDPSVQFSNPLTGKRENLMRRRIKYGKTTIPRRLAHEVIATVTKVMLNSGWSNNSLFADLNILSKRAIGEDDAFNQMMGIAEQLFSNSTTVNTFLDPLLMKPGDPIFTAPPRKGSKAKHPIPQDQVMSAWLESGKNFPLFVKELFLNLDADPADLPAFANGIMQRLRQVYHMTKQVASKSTQDPMNPNSHTPHRMMDARTNTIFPREWLEYDTFTKVDAGIHTAKLASVAAFGRDSRTLAGMLAAAQAEAQQLALPLGEIKQDPAYMALTTDKQRKEFLKRRLGDSYETASKSGRILDEINDLHRDLIALFAAPGGGFKDMRSLEELATLNQDLVLRTPKSGLWQGLSGMDYTQRLGYGTLSGQASGSFIYNSIKNALGSIFNEGLGLPLVQATESAKAINYIRSLPGQQDLSFKELFANQGVSGPGENLVKISRALKSGLDKSVGLKRGPAGDSGFAPFTPLSPFSWLNNIFGSAVGEGMISVWRTIITRGLQYIDNNPSVLSDPNFRFNLKHLGISGSLLGGNERTLEYFADTWAEHTGESLLNFMKRAYNRKQARQEIFNDEDYLSMYQIAMDDINLEGGIGSTPVSFRTNGILRIATPLLRWATGKTNAVHRSLGTQEGRFTVNSVLKGVAGISAVGFPIGIAATMLMDEYDEEILGKKSNLRKVDPINLLPGFGVYNMLTNKDGQGLAILERIARAGNVYGLGAEAIYGMAAWTDPMQGQRALGIDRILVYSQLANFRDAFVNIMHSGWYMNYEDGKRIADVIFGQAPAHLSQTINNLSGTINENERRRTKRVDAYNYLRAAGRSAGVPLKKSGIRTSPTPLTSRIRQMQLAAYGDDHEEFNAIFQDAIRVATEMGKEDPVGSIVQSWKAREPMDLFQRTLTEDEIASIFSHMNERGRENVLDLIRLHEKYLNYLSPRKPLKIKKPRRNFNTSTQNNIRYNRLEYLEL
tara:strand:+ start:4708 stop:23808 length:19101 start_codon:yes stop_codon:yes gene_type:complete